VPSSRANWNKKLYIVPSFSSEDEDVMALYPAVAVSSDGGSSGAFRRCLAPPEISIGLSVRLDSRWTSVCVPIYKGAGDGGPLPSNAWDVPDQSVQLEGEGDPDSVWPVQGWDLSNILSLDLNLILKLTLNLVLTLL
jgi:hypothetical protein